MNKEQLKIAVFFDAENISANYVMRILTELDNRGQILFRKAYADWSRPNMKKWEAVLSTTPIDPIHRFHKNEKQVLDKTIIMDAVQMVWQHPEIDCFCIVASDKGYSDLALRLREYGKFVLGIGEKEKTADLLLNSYNEFLYVEELPEVQEGIIENLAKIENRDKKDSDSENEQDLNLLNFFEEVYNATRQRDDGFASFADFGFKIRAFKPDFSYYRYGFSSLKEMVENFSDYFEIQEITDTQPPNYFLRKIQSEEKGSDQQKEQKESEELEGTVTRFIHHYGFICVNDPKNKEFCGDYFYSLADVIPESRGRISVNSQVSFRVRKAPNPDGKTSAEKNGKAILVRLVEPNA